MNLFGFDVRTLDIPGFVTAVHMVWWALGGIAVAWLLRQARDKTASRPWCVILLMAVAGHALAWFVTMFPLPNVYGTNGSLDRENHLGWAQVIVAGNSPIRTFQVDQIHFEPLWPNLVALAALCRAELVGAVFQIAPLVLGFLFLVSVFACVAKGLGDGPESRMEAAFAAFFALLLASAYGDQTAPFRNPWSLTFLLKPNHAVGLALLPWVLLAVSRAEDGKGRLRAAVLLHALGWAFIIHMAFVISGLMVFVALSLVERRRERGRDFVDTAAIIGLALILISPYVYMLRENISSIGTSARFGIAAQSAHFFDATLRLGLVFPLALFGAWTLLRGVSRFERLLGAQFVAAQINWAIYLVLGTFHMAKEMDEAFHWIRFLTAMVAGIGFWRLGRRAAPSLARLARRVSPSAQAPPLAATAAALLAMAAPAAIAGWWNPESMDRYFASALRPVPARIVAPTEFLRNLADGRAVVAGDRVYARYVPVYSGHRVLLADSLNPPWDFDRRTEIEAAIVRGRPASLIDEGWSRYGIRYLLVTPAILERYPDVTLQVLRSRSDLRLAFMFDAKDSVAIFELVR